MALACTWGGYADTDINFNEFFNSDHTVAVRFMLQYQRAYTGPMLSLNGTGTYLIGQGDFDASPTERVKLVMQIGNQTIYHAVDLPADSWHHLAVVRSANTFQMYLDGKAVGSSFSLSSSNLPNGKLRLGRNTFDAALDGGGTQFYGMLDDVAIFKKALSVDKISQLAKAKHLSGGEEDLYAGYVFGSIAPAVLISKLARPLKLTPAATIVSVSADRNNAADAQQLPLSLTSVMHLPFENGQVWQVTQGYNQYDIPCPNDPTVEGCGSHNGYVCFSLDLALANDDSNGKPIVATAPGTVDTLKEDAASGGKAPNFVSIKQAEHEFCDYLHVKQNSVKVDVNDKVSFQKYIADVGDTGVKPGNYHLHIAVTNLGEGKQSSGGTFITIPAAYTNYDASDDQGKTWQHVLRGIPRREQWIRRATSTSPVRYTAIWHPSSESEIQVYDCSYDYYRAKYDEIWKQGWRLKMLDVNVVNNQARYTAVWRPSTEDEIQEYGRSYKDYRAKYDELWKQGWRLKLLSVYVENGQVRYTAVWHPSTENETQEYDRSVDDFRARYDDLWKQGWRLKLLSIYVVNGQVRYTAAWRLSTEDEIQVYGWEYDDLRAQYDILWQKGWRLKLLDVYTT